MAPYAAMQPPSFMTSQGRCDVLEKLKKIIGYICLPVSFLLGWIISGRIRSKDTDGSGTGGKTGAELSEAGRDLERATEDLGRAQESAQQLADSVSDSADKAQRLGELDDEYQRIHRENSELIDELFGRIRANSQETECDQHSPDDTVDHIISNGSDGNSYVMEDW